MLCSFVTSKSALDIYIQTFDLLTNLTISYFPYDNEKAELATKWQISIYTDNSKETIELIQRVRKQFSLPNDSIATTEVENKDWVTEVQKNFKPIKIDNIYVYSSYYKDTLSKHKDSSICINIDPGNAFGTGEHHTTKGCLRALSQLSKTHTFSNIIDMGCGSAILAIAAAHLFKKAKILATDIDPDAIKVTKENTKKNNVNNIKAAEADGIHSPFITKKAPFDLIICNILSNVLIQISNDINKVSTKDTVIVLSGLTIRQLDDVTKSYSQHGFQTLDVIHEDEWCTIIMKKS